MSKTVRSHRVRIFESMIKGEQGHLDEEHCLYKTYRKFGHADQDKLEFYLTSDITYVSDEPT